MINVSINAKQFNEIKNLVLHMNPFFNEAGNYVGQIEVDVDEVSFIKISKTLGQIAVA